MNSEVYGFNSYPFVFYKTSSQTDVNTDQRTHIPKDGLDSTINLHPQDVWNTYIINRETATVTNTEEEYILPNAVTANGDVISENNLNYQDISYNTEYSVQNTTNYYGVADENNPNENNSQQGNNTGVSGITITDSFKQQQQQQQTIESGAVVNNNENSIATGAAQATITVQPNSIVINNTNNLSQEQIQEINNIINNGTSSNENSFEEAMINIRKFVDVGKEFGQVASVTLSFMPSWVTTLLGLVLSITFVMIVLRLIHLFV